MKTKQYCYNDYEILYMIKEGVPEAVEILVNKYKPLVYTRIKKFRIVPSQIDDYYQESLIVLNKAVNCYDQNSKMSFTNFYDLLLQRRFIDLLRLNRKYHENNILFEDIDIALTYTTNKEEKEKELNNEILKEEMIKNLSNLEYKIFELKYFQNLKAKEIALKLNISIKQVYAAGDRIKQKYRKKNLKK